MTTPQREALVESVNKILNDLAYDGDPMRIKKGVDVACRCLAARVAGLETALGEALVDLRAHLEGERADARSVTDDRATGSSTSGATHGKCVTGSDNRTVVVDGMGSMTSLNPGTAGANPASPITDSKTYCSACERVSDECTCPPGAPGEEGRDVEHRIFEAAMRARYPHVTLIFSRSPWSEEYEDSFVRDHWDGWRLHEARAARAGEGDK